jgi:carbamoyltransferase
MKVLGISGRDRDAAAALAVDGTVVSAAAEESFARVPNIGYAQSGGFPNAAVRACLDRAGLEAADVDQIVVVDDGRVKPSGSVNGAFRGVPVREVAAVRADALQAAMASKTAGSVMVFGSEPGAVAMFERSDADLGPRADVAGAEGLAKSAARVAMLLGLDARDPFAAIDRLSLGADPAFLDAFDAALTVKGGAIVADADLIAETVNTVAGSHAGALGDTDSLNAKVQEARRTIAASFTCRLARMAATLVERASDAQRGTPIAVGGALFGNARFNTELGRLAPGAYLVSPMPEAYGRAIGAVAIDPVVLHSDGMTIGPSFSEEDIKRTLDNCRLDYVYEPDWPRLVDRTSRMLSQGKIVGWFQGAMAFGPRALGTRSILADPASRYVRQNVNEYLRHRPIDEPLPLALASSMWDRAMGGSAPGGVRDIAVDAEWRQPLSGALGSAHDARVRTPAQAFDSRLRELLERHLAATGTPGLVEINLAGPGEPIACTPRDAVRTVYSSAIDALVIGRFLLMKDYWLLRSQS